MLVLSLSCCCLSLCLPVEKYVGLVEWPGQRQFSKRAGFGHGRPRFLGYLPLDRGGVLGTSSW